MIKSIFVDTSAFYAMINKGETHHGKIKNFIKKSKELLVTTNLIFAETISLITKRLGKNIAADFGSGLLNSTRLSIYYLSEDYQKEAWDLFISYKDKDFDYIDAACFTFMKKMNINKVLSFDRHFKQMGFEILP
ncbi:MAG: PIN domain-containing protein [Armatimonadota bacterium]